VPGALRPARQKLLLLPLPAAGQHLLSGLAFFALAVSIPALHSGIFQGLCLVPGCCVGCILILSCHLAGRSQSGADAKFWQNPGLEQKPQGHKTEYEQNTFHDKSFPDQKNGNKPSLIY
jgi:hypothetical protein